MKNANLKSETTIDSAVIAFPPTTAQKFVLSNGLTVIVQEDRSAPVGSVQAWCAAGSTTEDRYLGAGISHILEHMLFKGTKTRSTNQIAQKIQDVGGYINAYTSFDRTVFWIDVPKDGVPMALDILADAMMNSTLPAEEYAKEQEVIRREFAMGQDDPERTLTQLLFATAYQHHPYRLPVIGLADIYNQLSHADVANYYRTRYVPNNLTFIIVGDVNASEVRAQLERLFKDHPARSLPPIFIPPEPLQLGRREVHEEFPSELTHFAMAWHVPEIMHPDVPALDLLSIILGEGRSSRLYRKVREETGLAFAITAFCYTPGEPGIFGVEATLDPKNREEAQRLICEIVERIRQDGVTAAELTKAKKTALTHELGSLATMRGQASDLGTNWFLTRNLNFSRDYFDQLQKITADDVRRVAQKYLRDQNLSVVSLNPKGSLAACNAAKPAVSAGDIQKFELSNGLRVLVREDPRLPLVAISAVFRGGLLAETPETSGITRLAAKCLLKGTKNRSAEQIAAELEEVGGDISAKGGNNTLAIKVDVTQADLALGTEILADVLLNATMPEQAIAREKEIQLAKIKAESEQPISVARNALKTELFGQHPFALRGEGTPESLSHLNSKELLAFRDQYLVAKNGVIAVFGNVKLAEVKRLFEEKLSALPAGKLQLADAPIPEQLTRNRIVTSQLDKAQAVLMIGFRGADVFSEDRHALELIDEASSDLGSRFFIRIREKMGMAYFVGAGQVQALVPGLFAFYLGTDPEKVDQVKKAFLQEVRKLASEGLTEVELNRARKKLVGQQQIQNQSNDAFAYLAALDELYGLGYNHYRELEPKVNAITLADIQRVARKYFAEQPYVLSIVQPPPKPTKGK